ncbi:MAG: hypothetical protein JO257_23580 [Deltaproteobacteria bacterium]|nr:hypothetical protein [Deltaproteobacteria bacterium]
MKAALVLVAISGTALAGHSGGSSCSHGSGGGGHSGGGGGGYSSSNSSSSSSSSSEPASHGCEETTDIEGYRECMRFGMWANNMVLPLVFIETGSAFRRFQTLAGGTSTVTHGDESFAFRVVGPRAHIDSAVTWTARFGVGLPHGLYVALEGEAGGIVSPIATGASMETTGTFGSPDLAAQKAMVIGGSAVAGVWTNGEVGALGVEAVGGVRNVMTSFDSTYYDCEQSASVSETRGVLEVRARGEVWVNPWVSIGATVGSSVIEHDDWMAGIYVGMRSRAYGGLR